MGILRKQGEKVKIGYRNDTNGSAVAAVTLYDADGNARTLQSYERLIVDDLQFDTTATDAANLAYVIFAAATPPTTVPSQPVVASFSVAPNIGAQGFVDLAEGYAGPTGQNLFMVLVGDAWASASVALSGGGRIVNGKTQGFQAGYKALLTPGGNVSGV